MPKGRFGLNFRLQEQVDAQLVAEPISRSFRRAQKRGAFSLANSYAVLVKLAEQSIMTTAPPDDVSERDYEKLRDILEPGEKIIWVGHPTAARALSSFIPVTAPGVIFILLVLTVGLMPDMTGLPLNRALGIGGCLFAFYAAIVGAYFFIAGASSYLTYYLTSLKLIVRVDRNKRGFEVWKISNPLQSILRSPVLVSGQFILADLSWVSTVYVRPLFFGLLAGGDIIFADFLDTDGKKRELPSGAINLAEAPKVRRSCRKYSQSLKTVPPANRFSALENPNLVANLIVAASNSRRNSSIAQKKT